MKRTFQPTLGFSLLCTLMMALLLTLGTWQMQRKAWKEGLLLQIEKQKLEDPIALEKFFDKSAHINPQDYNYRPATITGTYLHQHEFLLAPRVLNGKAGAHVLTPFKTLRNDIILVNRGWVENNKEQNISHLNNEITLTGLIHTPPQKNDFTPDNDIENNIWYWVDMDALKTQTGLENFYPVMFYKNAEPEKDSPVGGQLRTKIPNDHLQYAITWYLLALILSVMYIVFNMRPKKD